MNDQHLIPNPDAAALDDERAAVDDAHRARFFDVCHRLAEVYDAAVVIKRSAARWDRRYSPPRLLAATVRFERPGLPKRTRRPRKTPVR